MFSGFQALNKTQKQVVLAWKYLHPGSLGDIIYSMPFMLSNEGVFEPEELPNADIHCFWILRAMECRYDVFQV